MTDSSRQEPGDRPLHPEREERGHEDEELHRPGGGVALHGRGRRGNAAH